MVLFSGGNFGKSFHFVVFVVLARVRLGTLSMWHSDLGLTENIQLRLRSGVRSEWFCGFYGLVDQDERMGAGESDRFRGHIRRVSWWSSALFPTLAPPKLGRIWVCGAIEMCRFVRVVRSEVSVFMFQASIGARGGDW